MIEDEPHRFQTSLSRLGLGLRTGTTRPVNEWPEVDWFEMLTENYMVDGGKHLHYLDEIRGGCPMVMHMDEEEVKTAAAVNKIRAAAERVKVTVNGSKNAVPWQ